MSASSPIALVTRLAASTAGAFRGSAAVTEGVSRKQLATLRAHGAIEPLFFDTVTGLATLISVGRWLEARAKERATSGLRAFLSGSARRARRLGPGEGEEQSVTAQDLRPGDRVKVLPGERIPADGRVLDGQALVDEAALTGEPLPRAVAAGDVVRSPTIPTDGPRARTANPTCHAAPVTGARSPIPRIVIPVSRKPLAVWRASADPAVPGGASSETAVENWAESATTVTPQTRPSTRMSAGVAPKRVPLMITPPPGRIDEKGKTLSI